MCNQLLKPTLEDALGQYLSSVARATYLIIEKIFLRSTLQKSKKQNIENLFVTPFILCS